MKNSWQTKKLGEVAAVHGGGTPPTNVPAYFQGNINWFTPTEIPKEGVAILGESRRKISKFAQKFTTISGVNSVLLTSRATIGTVGILSTASGYNQGIKGIEPSPELDPWYLAHWLRLNKDEIINKASGTTFKEISTSEVKKLEIPLPSLGRQKEIVNSLEKILEKIEKTKKNTEKNLQNSRDFFDSFLENIFNSPRKGWNIKILRDVFQIKPPKKEAKEKIKDDDFVSFVPMEDLGISKKVFSGDKERTLKEVLGSYTYFANNDVLLAKITPCFENGKLGIARNLKNGIGFGSSEYIVFRSKGDVIPDYLYYFLARNQFRKDGTKRMYGAVGHKRVSKEFVEESMIAYPSSISDQKDIVKKLDELSEQTKKLEEIYKKKLKDLEELKKSILTEAFAGRL